MDARRFDHLVRFLSTTNPRRGLLRLLTTVSLAGVLAALPGDAGAAKSRHQKRRHPRRKAQRKREDQRHETQQDRQQVHPAKAKRGKGKRRKGKRCEPKHNAKICARTCGPATNKCGKPVDCPPCPTTCAEACATGCCDAAGACQTGNTAEACGAAGGDCQNCVAQGQICVSGRCQAAPTCSPESCGECQWCDGTACEADPAAAGAPCFSATCDAGEVGRCVSGQCQCLPARTCFPDSCGECQRCNSTATACEVDLAAVGTLCLGTACEDGTEGRCNATGQCQCQPQQTCSSGSCGECQRCNDTATACEADPVVEGLPCYNVTCESPTPGLCAGGQCRCEEA